ncbi:MAG TPA: hypothetical protein DEQ62_06390, partial [Verrucomicrobiales bacterium]|nr:hypothetical protein [Verrucomicrobiales bacterium]
TEAMRLLATLGVLGLASGLWAAEKMDLAKGREHWAFQPVQRAALPAVKAKDWPVNGIDHFILARLEKAGLQPAPVAAPRDLQRRLNYALTGLPPKAYSKFVNLKSEIENLMATPQYGERWARHWLDVVRYADSNGLDENAAHANAWRYRDYVVNAFNADKPYDQFLIEQIAGDLQAKDSQEDARRRELFIATGFLSLGPKVLAEPDKVKMEMDIIDEQIDTLGKALLGLTLGCARCHDHKFDPIPTADYYALAGIFKSTKTMESLKTIAKWHENSVATPAEKRLREKHDVLIDAQKKLVAAFTEKANAQLLVSRKIDKLPAKPEEKYPKTTRNELGKLRAALKQLEDNPPPLVSAMGVTDGNATELPVFVRGDHNTPASFKQPRRFPQVLSDGKPLGNENSGRLALAQWIADKKNPLTARVMVNRVWRWHFGRGLVATTDNFGLLGERPSHPDLLDWLAAWFMDNGWSVKKLNTLILTSATYQMSSTASPAALQQDANNVLLSRTPLRRLEAEPLRDSLLELGGLLDKQVGGFVWTFENYKLVFNHTSEDATTYESNRRALYLPVIRNHVYDLFELFDFPDPGTVNGNRADSTIAPQALYLMNSPLVLRATESMAEALLKERDLTNAQRVQRLYAQVFNRPPTVKETQRAVVFINNFAQDRLASWQALSQALVSSNEFLYLK